MLMSIETRLQTLEDDRAIRDLKARYLRACDSKDPDTLRDTLLPNGAVVAYEGFPTFNDREDFIAIYQQMGCSPDVFDIHHGANGVITLDGPKKARGQWSLFFHTINLQARILMQMGVEYDDVYSKIDGRWWIAETRSRRLSCLIHTVDADGKPTVTVMGHAPARFG
jgi:SnoaL-like domain